MGYTQVLQRVGGVRDMMLAVLRHHRRRSEADETTAQRREEGRLEGKKELSDGEEGEGDMGEDRTWEGERKEAGWVECAEEKERGEQQEEEGVERGQTRKSI